MTYIFRFPLRLMSYVLGRIYAFFYRIGESFEGRFGAYFTLFEITLILLGVVNAIADVRSRYLSVRGESNRADGMLLVGLVVEQWRVIGDILIFACLLGLALSRVLTALRRRYLGYYIPSSDHSDVLFAKVKALEWGFPPLLGTHTHSFRIRFAEAIAKQTSVALSIRVSGGLRDKRWMQREREHLDRWFSTYPDVLWKIPLGSDYHSNDVGGYFSVLLPITDDSRRSIQKGTLATDMADIDRDVLTSISSVPRVALESQLNILAYLHIFCPEQSKERIDSDLLAASSFQHLAHLLYTIYGNEGNFLHNWNFSIMCESANRSQDFFLMGLGFSPVQQRTIETSRASTLSARSYGDFRLFEFDAVLGHASGSGDRVDATRFLELLQDLVSGYPTDAKRIARDGAGSSLEPTESVSRSASLAGC
jgi:hypothetical protein